MSNRLAAIIMAGVVCTGGAILLSQSLRGTLPSNWKQLCDYVEPHPRGSALPPGQERRLRDLVDSFALDANRRLLEAANWPEAASRFTPGLRREALAALVNELNADPRNGAEPMMRAAAACSRAIEAEGKLPPVKDAPGPYEPGSWFGAWLGVDRNGTDARAVEQFLRLLEAEGAWAALDEAMRRARCTALPTLSDGWWRSGEFYHESIIQSSLSDVGRAALAAMRSHCAQGQPETAALWLLRCGAIIKFQRSQHHAPAASLRADSLEWAATTQVMALAAEGKLPPAQLRELIVALQWLRREAKTEEQLKLRSAFVILDSLQRRLTEPDTEAAAGVYATLSLADLVDPHELLVFRQLAESTQDWREIRSLREAWLRTTPIRVLQYPGLWADAARLVLAIELHRAEHNGQLPASLSELVPSILRELPPEPVGAPPLAAGAPPGPNGDWGYRVLAEPDQFGRRYLVYSFGPDRTDDGGRMIDPIDGNGLRQPIGSNPKEPREPDHVFNRPRPLPRGQ